MSINKNEIFERLEKIDSLPTLPTVASQLLDVLGDEKTSMADITKIVEVDPSLTSKILKIANSPAYGLRKKIDTIRLALVVLGIEEVTNILLSISLFKTFDSTEHYKKFDKERFWEHSVGVAHIAKTLSKQLKIKMHGEEFTGGLIHDIGKIILEQYFNYEFNLILEKIEKDKCPFYVAENEIIGTNHMEIGAWIVKKWKLPDNLVEGILNHHNPTKSEQETLLAAIINLSDMFAHSANLSQSMSYEVLDIEGSKSWEVLKYLIPKSVTFDIQRFTMMIEDEIVKIKEFMDFAR